MPSVRVFKMRLNKKKKEKKKKKKKKKPQTTEREKANKKGWKFFVFNWKVPKHVVAYNTTSVQNKITSSVTTK